VKEYAPSSIRNIALIAHGGAGKTSLAESLLWTAKASSRLGRVDEGTSVLDSSPEEIERKITISLGLAQFEWKGTRINLIDTPGYLDFVGDVVAGLRVADAALVVIRAPAGVEVGTELTWTHAADRGLPALVAVTMMDKEHANFERCVTQAAERLSAKIAALYLPIGEAEAFDGVVDVLGRKAFAFVKGNGTMTPRDIPAEMKDAAEAARGRLLDAIAESDEALLEKYLDGQELTAEEIATGLRAAVVSRSLIPAIPVSGARVQGTGLLLDTIVALAPSPADAPATSGTAPGGNGNLATRTASATEPLAAFVFKMVSEAHMGDLALFRVYSGTLESGTDAWNASAGQPERFGALYTLLGKERHETQKVGPGDIGAAVKLKATHTGQTITSKDSPLILPPIPFPEPMLSVAIRPRAKGDEEKIGNGLHRLHEEDPTFQVRTDEMHQTILYGMGELQLEVIVQRLKRRYQVDVDLTQPKVPYRETIRAKVEKDYRHKKQTGGRGQFAEAHLRLEPLPRGTGFEFVDEVVGGVVPRQYIPAVEKGIREALTEGILAGYQVVDVRAALFFGKFHPVDSSEMAFKIAGSMAFKNGAAEANPVLLEPILEAEVVIPEEYMGDVMGDVSSRRGRILGMESDGRYQHIRAHVPQAELYKYSTHLRSLTQGRARYTTKFSHYEEVPREQAEKIIAAAKEEREKERVS
jgi:elongation factor G